MDTTILPSNMATSPLSTTSLHVIASAHVDHIEERYVFLGPSKQRLYMLGLREN